MRRERDGIQQADEDRARLEPTVGPSAERRPAEVTSGSVPRITDLATLAIHLAPQSSRDSGSPRDLATRWQPALDPAAMGADRWRGRCAFALLPRPHGASFGEVLGRQLHVIGYLLALPEEIDWSLQLRLVARAGQAGDPATLALHLLAAVEGATSEGARRRLHALVAALDTAAAALVPWYTLTPVNDTGILNAILDDFHAAELVEIGPQREAVALGGARTTVPIALPDHGGLLHWLCQALMNEAARNGHTLAWIVTLERAGDLGLVRAALSEGEARARATYHDLERTAVGADDGTVALLERADTLERGGIQLALLRRQLTGHGGRVQAFVVAEGCPVPPAAIAAAIAECSDSGAVDPASRAAPATVYRPVRPQERTLALSALRGARCLDWEADGRGEIAGGAALLPSLRRVADVRQIGRLFRLPVAGADGLPGLCPTTETRTVWLADAPHPVPDGLLLGENVGPDGHQPIWLGPDDRRRHAYLVGQTGTGKSTTLLSLISQDLATGRGLAVFDFHGDLIEATLALVPTERIDEVVLLDPGDAEYPVGFNFLECGEEERDRVIEGFLDLLYQLFDPHRQGIVGPRFEHAVRNAMHTVMATEGLTLVEVMRLLMDHGYARELLPRVTDPLVRKYWTDQIAATSDFHKSEVLDYIVSKFGPFVTNRLVRNIVGQSRSAFSLRRIMDEGGILLVNLSAGRLGVKTAAFLGNILIPRLLHAAFSRVDIPEEERRDFTLYADEFQEYATPSFVDIIAGARKYRLNLVMAHQHVAQLPHAIRTAIFGNVGTLLGLRVGVDDAPLLAAAMSPSAFGPSDLIALPNFTAAARVLHDGRRSEAFTLATNPAPTGLGKARAEEVRLRARLRHGRPRTKVEAEIAQRARL